MVARIDHAFETIRTEFDSIQGEVHTLRAQRDELESKGAFHPRFTTAWGILRSWKVAGKYWLPLLSLFPA